MKIHFIILSFFLISCAGSRQISMQSYAPENRSGINHHRTTKQPSQSITFHNRMNMFDMAQKLEKEKIMDGDEFLRIAMDDDMAFVLLKRRAESLEGYLHPGTYTLTRDTSAQDLVEEMVQRSLQAYEEATQYSNLSWSRHEVVTLASMIEKEALKEEEKPVISSVFHNRLNAGMKFQSDPTVYYGVLRETGSLPQKVGRSGFKIDTPYNTYTRESFPAGPISNPNYESLRAVLYPERTDYFYFVSKNNGTHAFNKTYQQHLRDVQYYQR